MGRSKKKQVLPLGGHDISASDGSYTTNEELRRDLIVAFPVELIFQSFPPESASADVEMGLVHCLDMVPDK